MKQGKDEHFPVFMDNKEDILWCTEMERCGLRVSSQMQVFAHEICLEEDAVFTHKLGHKKHISNTLL